MKQSTKKSVIILAAVFFSLISDTHLHKVSDKDIAIIADAVGNAFNAHYSGDEDPSLRKMLDKSKLSLWGRFILEQEQYVLDGLWTDLKPADNNIKIQF